MRQQRRGETALETIGGIVVAVIAIAVIIQFVKKDDGGQGGGTPFVDPPKRSPNPVVVEWKPIYNPRSHDEVEAVVQNNGGPGDVRFVYSQDGGYNFEYSAYFNAGERRKVRFTTPDAPSGEKCRLRVTAR